NQQWGSADKFLSDETMMEAFQTRIKRMELCKDVINVHTANFTSLGRIQGDDFVVPNSLNALISRIVELGTGNYETVFLISFQTMISELLRALKYLKSASVMLPPCLIPLAINDSGKLTVLGIGFSTTNESTSMTGNPCTTEHSNYTVPMLLTRKGRSSSERQSGCDGDIHLWPNS
ncbi:hypothetical protein PMAYCL1PPCAC_21942, partial [Pristionchus mayeri]